MPAAVLALLLVVAAIRGSSYLPMRYALEDLTPLQVVLLEAVVASVVIAAAIALTGRGRALAFQLRTRPLPALRLASLQTVLPFALVAVGLQHVPTGTASVLVCAAPLMATAIAGATNPLDRPTRVQGVGLLVGLAGVSLVVGVEAVGTADQALGALALLGAALAYVLSGLAVRRDYKGHDPMTTAGVAIVPALLILLPVALLSPPPVADVGLRAASSLVVLGAGCTALALVLFYALQRRVGPIRALLVSYLNPIVAVLLGVVVLSESITGAVVAGMGFIVAGVALATRPDPRAAAAAAAPDRALALS